jgi:hypothetical protein
MAVFEFMQCSLAPVNPPCMRMLVRERWFQYIGFIAIPVLELQARTTVAALV